MDAFTLGGFLLMGLTGSLHCAGMCGPIIWVLPFQQQHGMRRGLGIALYHTGRIISYCLLGLLFFNIRGAFNPQWQQAIALVTGAALLLLGILTFVGAGSGPLLRPVANLITRPLALIARRSSTAWLGLTGVLNGLLPCGMLYMALAASMKSPDIAQALISMALFGLGTVPMLLAVVLLRRRVRFPAVRWTNALILAFGLLIMLRGANLGIPFLSPARVETETTAAPAINCCHKEK